MSKHVHRWTDAPDWSWPSQMYGADARAIECVPCGRMRVVESPRCIFPGCAAAWKHYHGGFPGGFDNPDDPTGPPIAFVGPDPDPAAVRDYNGRKLA